MPIYYLDASAVVKRYLTHEVGIHFMRLLLEDAIPDEIFYVSTFGVLEVNAAIRRRVRNERTMDEALRIFSQELVGLFRVVPTGDNIVSHALSVIETHRLRAGDAIHLATALDLADANISQVFMISADTELLEASEAAGLGAIDPQVDEAMVKLGEIREL